jgi:ligand-binding sensor domain-containing protein
LYYDPDENAMFVGSSKGLVRFSADFSRSAWTRDDGLISNEVNHVVRLANGELAAGTGGGVSILGRHGIRSIYAFHGLVNNKVFCLQPLSSLGLTDADSLLAVGTLGGINLLKGYNVADQITPDNSELPIHWITALAEYEGGLLIGTYGAGLSLRERDGTWPEMPGQVRDVEINPNALLVDSDIVLAGTLDRGLIVHRRATARWEYKREGIGSLNVTAFSTDGQRYYIGTDNGLLVVAKGSL